jgi:MtrB/PioB family decaheme-associated outer membrane protein
MRTLNRLLIPAGALLVAATLTAVPARGQATADPNVGDKGDKPAAAPAAEMAKPATSAKPEGGFTLRLDPIVLGVLDSHVDTRSAKYEEFRDVSNGFILPFFHLDGESADGNRTLDFTAKNVARTDARYTIDYGVAGQYELFFDYNKIPHHFGNDGHMLWTRTADGRLEIPDAVQGQIQNAIATQFAKNPGGITYSFLNNLLAPYLANAQALDLGLERDRSDARLDLGKMGPLALTVEYTHENRRGNRPIGASFGFSNATEVPEPIDYDTDGAQIAGEWKGQRGGLEIGYRYSKFKNNINTLTWDNPFRLTDSTDPAAYTAPGAGSINGPSKGLIDLAPSNDANMAFANGKAKLPGGWWVNGSAFFDMMKQDDPLLPYTLNTSIVGVADNGSKFDPTNLANLPARSFNGKVDFDLNLRYRYYDYNDKSPRIEFPGYVRFQSVWENVARITVPYSYTRQNEGAELGWDVHPTTRLALSFDRESWNREFREVKDTDENIWKLSVDTRPSSHFTLRGSYEHGDRTIGPYNTAAQEDSFVVSQGITNLPDLRKFDEAARTYNAWKLQAQVFATESINFSLGTTGRKDDYSKSLFGLESDDVKAYNAELSYSPGPNRDFFLFGERMDRTTIQNGRVSGAVISTNPLDSWAADLQETTDTWGLGWNEKLGKLWTLDVSGNLSRSDGQARFPRPVGANPPGVGFGNYDDVDLLSVGAKLDYALNPAATVGLFYRYEKYTINSFLTEGLASYLPGTLLLNANNGDYKANIYGFTMKYIF